MAGSMAGGMEAMAVDLAMAVARAGMEALEEVLEETVGNARRALCYREAPSPPQIQVGTSRVQMAMVAAAAGWKAADSAGMVADWVRLP